MASSQDSWFGVGTWPREHDRALFANSLLPAPSIQTSGPLISRITVLGIVRSRTSSNG